MPLILFPSSLLYCIPLGQTFSGTTETAPSWSPCLPVHFLPSYSAQQPEWLFLKHKSQSVLSFIKPLISTPAPIIHGNFSQNVEQIPEIILSSIWPVFFTVMILHLFSCVMRGKKTRFHRYQWPKAIFSNGHKIDFFFFLCIKQIMQLKCGPSKNHEGPEVWKALVYRIKSRLLSMACKAPLDLAPTYPSSAPLTTHGLVQANRVLYGTLHNSPCCVCLLWSQHWDRMSGVE